jgi:hypothetical protein
MQVVRIVRWVLLAAAVFVIASIVVAVSFHDSTEESYAPLKANSGMERLRLPASEASDQSIPLRERGGR